MTEDEAIRRGYPPQAHRVICVDWDGTVVRWGSLEDENPDLLPGAIEALRKLVAHDYRLVVFTSRMSPQWLDASGHSATVMRSRIAAVLDRHAIPFLDITAEKVPAEAYVDDRAIRYHDNWPEIVDWLLFSRGDA